MKSIKNDITNEIIIKNSRFITKLIKLNNNNIEALIDEVKKEYPKATHYCYAYIYNDIKRSSDDKEPSGTAGQPMLNVLEKENLMNICAITIRYFGGIKLGAGGLIRAYSKSVKEALDNTEIIDLKKGYKVEIEINYDMQKNLDYVLKNELIINKEFNETVKYTVLIEKENIDIINKYEYKVLSEEYY